MFIDIFEGSIRVISRSVKLFVSWTFYDENGDVFHKKKVQVTKIFRIEA